MKRLALLGFLLVFGLSQSLLAQSLLAEEKKKEFALPRISVQGEVGLEILGFVNFPSELALTPGSFSGPCCDPKGQNRSQNTPLETGPLFPLGAGATVRPFPGKYLRHLGFGAKMYFPKVFAPLGWRGGFISSKPLTYFYPGEEEYTYSRIVKMQSVPQFEITYSGLRLGEEGEEKTTVLEIGAKASRHRFLMEQGWDSFDKPNEYRTASVSGWMYGGLVRFKFPTTENRKYFFVLGTDFSYGNFKYDLPAGAPQRYYNLQNQWEHAEWNRPAWILAFTLGFEWGPF